MKKCTLLLIIISFGMIMTGCWNRIELDEISIAVAIGVDQLDNDLFEVSAQIVLPRLLRHDLAEENATLVYTATGRTVFEAMRRLGSIANGRIFIGHTQVLVLGESLTRAGIYDVIDFFERDHETRGETLVMTSKGISAQDVLQTKSIADPIPAIHITSIIENSVNVANTRILTLHDFIDELNCPGCELVLGTIGSGTSDKPELIKDLAIEGLIAFDGDQSIDYLNPTETRGYLWIKGEIEGGILVIPSPGDKNKLLSMEILHIISEMDVKLVDNKLVLVVNIQEEGNIGEQQVTKDLSTPEALSQLEEEKNKLIRSEIGAAFFKAQKELQVDLFRFGQLVHHKYPKLYKEIEADWNEAFSNASVEINVETKIRSTGLISAPSVPR
ncbi:spore germination B3 GerAC family protein [Alkaliphilus metalliredigens QYMF]|uniref:Spore germination B3 GerAC family protein n=1 Tax=Alkaliphilus metalliredigens (strain QYMF) TaxID=293826 RepID=A6TMS1_ALKMQ|nr:Ger(x)C family spore germination protein [Alkaliphilus metalliredigens]ABR47489.1 spore germination B3 GerAC family protein [Alkaliphilus metalliredigens QYMF]